MLKWTVGHRKGAAKRSPSSGSGGGGGGSAGPCYSIRRAAARLQQAAARRSGGSSGSRDKENRDDPLSPRTRDSVYMRLDSIPAALRDLSNQLAPDTNGAAGNAAGVVTPTRRPRASLAKTPKTPTAPVTGRRAPRSAGRPRRSNGTGATARAPRTPGVEPRAASPAPALPPRMPLAGGNRGGGDPAPAAPGVDYASADTSPPKATATAMKRCAASPLRIEYSPCPLRATRSLLTLRRRLAAAFGAVPHALQLEAQHHHEEQQRRQHAASVQPQQRSLPVLPSLHMHENTIAHDNPLYYTLRQRTRAEASLDGGGDAGDSLSPDEELPRKVRRRLLLPPPAAPEAPSDAPAPAPAPDIASVSPLTRHLQSLRLSGGGGDFTTDHMFNVSATRVMLNNSSSCGNIGQLSCSSFTNVHAGANNISDPGSCNVFRENKCNDNRNDQENSNVEMVIAWGSEMAAAAAEAEVDVGTDVDAGVTESWRQTDDFKAWRQLSLRRSRTLSQGAGAEDGPPPAKMPASDLSRVHAPHKGAAPAPGTRRPSWQERRRPRRSGRRRSRSASGGLGGGAPSSPSSPSALASPLGRRSGSGSGGGARRASTSGEELDDECAFTLRRRGGFRRRARHWAMPPPPTQSQPQPEQDDDFGSTPLARPPPRQHPRHRQRQQASFSSMRYGPAAFTPSSAARRHSPSTSPCTSPCRTPSPPNLHAQVPPTALTVPPLQAQMRVSMETRMQPDMEAQIEVAMETLTPSPMQVQARSGLTLPAGIPSPPSPLQPAPAAAGPTCPSPPFREPAPLAPPAAAAAARIPPATASTSASTSPSSEGTWNSHRMHFLKTPRLSEGHVLAQRPFSDNEDPQLVPSGEALSASGGLGSTPVLTGGAGADSPLALVDQCSRSRRCLTFSSPGGSMRPRRYTPWRRSREAWPESTTPTAAPRGELDLAIYGNSGLLTVHVICGRNLRRAGGSTCNAYVKVALVPASEERTFHRTVVHRECSAPCFDHKFSCELLPHDLEKRVLVSVWHRDKEKRRSEFLGCMSFAVKHAVKKEISGSFRLLSQSAGRTQHAPAAAATPAPAAAAAALRDRDAAQRPPHADAAASTPTHAMERRKTCAKKKVSKPTPGGASAGAPSTSTSSSSSAVAATSTSAPAPAAAAASTSASAGGEDNIFLRHLELEPCPEVAPAPASSSARGAAPGAAAPGVGAAAAAAPKAGRTPFTTTRRLTRPSPHAGFGFSVAWTQPPRVERVEAGQPAERAGLRPGDYVIFVEKHNVVTLPEEEVLQLIRSCGNTLTLEVYRRGPPNGLVGGGGGGAGAGAATSHSAAAGALAAAASAAAPGTVAAAAAIAPAPSPAPPPRSSTTCSATTTSLDLSKRRLHLPQVTFSSEAGPASREEVRRRTALQLLHKEQHFAQAMHFGVGRFLLPLADRKDLISASDHQTLFQNAEELLRLSEDILEHSVGEEGDQIGQSLGRTYFKKINVLTNAYRRYFLGLKKADCLLVAKTRNTEFMRNLVEPPVPRKRPDLTTFLHKPLEHYRDILKLLQTILHYTKIADEDYSALSKVVHELQVTYREVMAGAGLMEPEAEGRPLLSLQDLESRLVFTRCKPFVLNTPGRQWLFGGDLSRVEGRAVRPFWALLFTDLLLFAKVSRDRVLFITDEPLSLLAVTQAFFNIRKRANEFRLLMDGGPEGTDSPAAAGCGPELPLSRNPRKGIRRRTITLRAPNAELKAVWQNLIQRQIIYLNTARGGTPASSPLDSPDQPTTVSVATLDSISLRRQTPQMQDAKSMKSLNNSQRHLDELIEHKCRQLGKSGASKGSALHLAQWMRGQLGGATGPLTPDEEPEPEVWSPETLRKRSEQLQILGGGGLMPNRNESRCEEIELSDNERSISRSTERSRSHSTSDSQVTVRSGGPEQPIAVCRKCHKTCLASNTISPQNPTENDMNALDDDDEEDLDEKWGPLMFWSLSAALGATVVLGPHAPADPFSPTEVPMISVLPPTPDTIPRSSSFQWDDADTSANVPTLNSSLPTLISFPAIQEQIAEKDDDEESCDNEDEEPPYKSLTSVSGLKRYGTLASLDMLEGDEEPAAEDSSNSEEPDEWDSDAEEKPQDQEEDQKESPPQLEAVTQSLRGWTARAGSFVAEKMALFERLGEDSRAAAFLDRYLRPAAETQLTHVLAGSLPDPATTSSDDCETSAATSDDVWGTPTSGGDMDDISFPSPESAVASQQESPAISPTTACGDEEAELMMDELLATPPLTTTPRGFPPRRRLEPLLEEEDTDISPSSTPVEQEETPSPEQGSGVGGAADIYTASSPKSARKQPPGFFNRLRLCKNQGGSRKIKGNKLLSFLSDKKSDGDGGKLSGRKTFFRIFGHHHVDDIPTSLPPQLTPCWTNEKQLDKRFWRQLRRRRRVESTILSPAQIPT